MTFNQGHFPKVKVTVDVAPKNDIEPNFSAVRDRAFIFHMRIPCDNTFIFHMCIPL